MNPHTLGEGDWFDKIFWTPKPPFMQREIFHISPRPNPVEHCSAAPPYSNEFTYHAIGSYSVILTAFMQGVCISPFRVMYFLSAVMA